MQIFEFLKAFLIGIVQGITEWLPVSSTGHMILLNSVLKLNVSEAFWDMFLVVIQLGSILAVLVLFWNRLYPFSAKSNMGTVVSCHRGHHSLGGDRCSARRLV